MTITPQETTKVEDTSNPFNSQNSPSKPQENKSARINNLTIEPGNPFQSEFGRPGELPPNLNASFFQETPILPKTPGVQNSTGSRNESEVTEPFQGEVIPETGMNSGVEKKQSDDAGKIDLMDSYLNKACFEPEQTEDQGSNPFEESVVQGNHLNTRNELNQNPKYTSEFFPQQDKPQAFIPELLKLVEHPRGRFKTTPSKSK